VPAAAELEVEVAGATAEDRETWIALTFDVLGLLDAGRAAASRELSRAEARAAWSDIERAAWSARTAVERARTELGDSLAKINLLTDLLASSSASVARAELLFERGRVSESEIARLRGMVAEVGHELHLQRVAVAEHRRALADAAGLPPSATALEAPTSETFENLFRGAELRPVPTARELLDRNPDLRRARLEYAVTEALLRDEVARTRPGLRLGPAWQITPDDSLPGGMLVLDLPHARALSGRVEAARQMRERAREELEEQLRASLARIEQARTEYEAAREALATHAASRELETNTVWRAACARFAIDPLAVEGVGMALRDRASALLDLFDVRRELVLAWLEMEAELGPEPRPLPGAEALSAAREDQVNR
jgi:outer membrane protein TolC